MTKQRRFLATLLLLTLISSVAAFLSATFIRARLIDSLVAQDAQADLVLAEQLAHLLETEIKSIHEKVNLIAQFPQIQGSDSATCNKKLAEAAEHIKGQLDNITRFNTNLVLDCAINTKALGYTLTPDSPITAVIKDPEHKPHLSYSGYSPVSNQEVLYLNIPVYDAAGAYTGIIGGVIYLNYLGDKYLKHLPLDADGFVTLLDDNGGLLFHPDQKYIGKNFDSPEFQAITGNNPELRTSNENILRDSQAGKSGTVSYTLAGQEKIAAYAPARVFPNRTWTVVMTVPRESIVSKIEADEKFGGFSAFLSLYSAIFLIFILFSALVLFAITKGLFKPLLKIKNVTEKIGRGNFAIEIDSQLLSAQDEFGQLARSIQQMARHLHGVYGTLEKKVQEKTKALSQKVTELERVNRVLVGREIKMTELKKEIERLKNQQ